MRTSLLGKLNVESDSQFNVQYYGYICSQSICANCSVVLSFAIINLLLILPDWYFIPSLNEKIAASILRAAFSLMLIAFIPILRRIRRFLVYARFLSALELTGVSIFLLILFFYESPNLLIQSMGLMIIMIGIFLFPNKWSYMIVVSTLSFTAFIIVSLFEMAPDAFSDMLAGWVYILLTMILSAIGARNIDQFRRREYLALTELERLGTTDPLTKASNRLNIEQRTNDLLSEAKKSGQPLSLVFIDVDNLKYINDEHGHFVGDQVLIGIVEHVRQHLRSNDIVVRWGGDEFIIIMPNTNIQDAVSVTKRIHSAVSSEGVSRGIHATCSFGIVESQTDSVFSTLLSSADKLMYEAKAQGKNRMRYSDVIDVL